MKNMNQANVRVALTSSTRDVLLLDEFAIYSRGTSPTVKGGILCHGKYHVTRFVLDPC
jgi:hypothetical protein